MQGSIDTDVKSSINSVIEDLTEMIEVAEDLTEDEEELKTLELGSVEKQFLENMESFNNLNEALQSLSSQNDKASRFRLYPFISRMAFALINNVFECFVFRLQVIRRPMVDATTLLRGRKNAWLLSSLRRGTRRRRPLSRMLMRKRMEASCHPSAGPIFSVNQVSGFMENKFCNAVIVNICMSLLWILRKWNFCV